MKNETKLKPAHLLSNLGNRTDFQDVVTIVELNVTTILFACLSACSFVPVVDEKTNFSHSV